MYIHTCTHTHTHLIGAKMFLPISPSVQAKVEEAKNAVQRQNSSCFHVLVLARYQRKTLRSLE